MARPRTPVAALAAAAVAALVLYPAGAAMAQTVTQQLFAAVDAADTEAIERLFSTGAANVDTLIDGQGNTALHLAAERCHPAVVRWLMRRGARANLANYWNDTPYRVAAVRCGAESQTVKAFAPQ